MYCNKTTWVWVIFVVILLSLGGLGSTEPLGQRWLSPPQKWSLSLSSLLWLQFFLFITMYSHNTYHHGWGAQISMQYGPQIIESHNLYRTKNTCTIVKLTISVDPQLRRVYTYQICQYQAQTRPLTDINYNFTFMSNTFQKIYFHPCITSCMNYDSSTVCINIHAAC